MFFLLFVLSSQPSKHGTFVTLMVFVSLLRRVAHRVGQNYRGLGKIYFSLESGYKVGIYCTHDLMVQNFT